MREEYTLFLHKVHANLTVWSHFLTSSFQCRLHDDRHRNTHSTANHTSKHTPLDTQLIVLIFSECQNCQRFIAISLKLITLLNSINGMSLLDNVILVTLILTQTDNEVPFFYTSDVSLVGKYENKMGPWLRCDSRCSLIQYWVGVIGVLLYCY